ncbi:signal recognition particle-docking protein FtsY [Gracilinema caldarium]|uniref:Signal recognition particle-docking protein FtsY n=1 Tax=Gracilinema caldarium (strain ATCC 51460 / DSM 7334 / H1) TaxID=744872 RepID=F8F1P8_GRAC1|nr:signal recognition particle-docking protein FtsY [Gracilinema caldarium]AEJ19382.1 signal recognition particle-docking protein FtsY [Gracilinema caldarium DSM 7334]
MVQNTFAEKLKRLIGIGSKISDDFFDELADLLVEGDFGASEAIKTVEMVKFRSKKAGLVVSDQIRSLLAQVLIEKLLPIPENHGLYRKPDALTILLLLGVNGVGKTTTGAKLAYRYQTLFQMKPILAAADTFRAAAIDQLKIHGDRLGIRVVAHKQGGDPAAVIYDAIEAAQASGTPVVIGDTAGRMHTKTALVEELKKIDRIVAGKASNAVYYKLLVLDATTGRNAYTQAEVFHSAVKLDGVILTKYDSSAKGGIVFSLAESLKLPVMYICTGETYGDIYPFNPEQFVKTFIGLS